MPTQKLYVGTDSEKGMWYNTVGKIVNQDDLGEDWIRVGNRITSELPSKLRFQDDLWTGKKKKWQCCIQYDVTRHPLIHLQSEVSCGCGNYSLCCLKSSAWAIITKRCCIKGGESVATSTASVLLYSYRQDRYEFSGEESAVRVKIWRRKNKFLLFSYGN